MTSCTHIRVRAVIVPDLKAIIVKEEFKKLQLVHAKFYGARETRLLRSYRKTVNSLKAYRR